LILADLNCGASRVTGARDRLVWLDLDARLKEAEQRGEDLEAEQTRKVDEEFRKILEQTLGLSSAVCEQLLKTETKVDQSQDEEENFKNEAIHLTAYGYLAQRIVVERKSIREIDAKCVSSKGK
jgi:hypothetical protein